MPDAWESANGLNASDAADGKLYSLSDGYTNLEIYLNGLVSHIVDAQNVDGVVTALASPIKDNSRLVKVYPNPVKDRLYFESETTIAQVQVGAFNGAVLVSLMGDDARSGSIDFGALSKGLYWVLFRYIDGTNSVVRVIK
jgi:hypothetical protein